MSAGARRRLAAAALLLWSAAAVATPEPGRERIVTLAPHLAELVCAVGACGELVAVGAYSDYPPQVKKLEVVGDVASLGYERLLGLRPTRVYAWAGGTTESQLARLRALGLPVVALQISTLEDVASTLRQLGSSLGHGPEGATAAARFTARIAALRSRYAGARKLRVFYQIETDPAYTVNAASPISQVIALCGGINVFGNLPALSAPVSVEAVLATAPDVVLHSEHDARAIHAYWARFAGTPVVKFHNIYGVDANLVARAGPRLADGAEAICAALDAARAKAP